MPLPFETYLSYNRVRLGYSCYSKSPIDEIKKIFEKTHCVEDAGAEINSVRVIITYAVMAFTTFLVPVQLLKKTK